MLMTLLTTWHARSISYAARGVAVMMALLLLAGCSTLGNANNRSAEPEPDLSELVHAAAEQMVASNPELTRYSPMIAATFVSIDNLSQSSTLGRMSSEIMASALSRQGMQVREVKMRDSMFIEERGRANSFAASSTLNRPAQCPINIDGHLCARPRLRLCKC